MRNDQMDLAGKLSGGNKLIIFDSIEEFELRRFEIGMPPYNSQDESGSVLKYYFFRTIMHKTIIF